MTTIDDLVALVPPPLEPVDASGDWEEVEAVLGLTLPSDFKALVERYGLGQFVDFITPLTPFGTHDLMLRSARRLLDGERAFRDKHPDKCPYPYYLEPGGLLEWAGTDNGDRLCWVTDGEPDAWTVVAWNPRGWYYDAHRTGAVEFLVRWLDGRLTDTVFPDNEHVTAPWFEPHRTLEHVCVKLTDGELPYLERLRILREAVAPTADRGSYVCEDEGEEEGEDDGERQDHFAATGLGWNFTYETAYDHQIRVAFPPGDEDRVRSLLSDVVRRMGCEMLSG